MLANHKIATAIGAVGAAGVLGHVVLGPSIVPVAVALSGAILVAAVGLYLVLARRRGVDHAEG